LDELVAQHEDEINELKIEIQKVGHQRDINKEQI